MLPAGLDMQSKALRARRSTLLSGALREAPAVSGHGEAFDRGHAATAMRNGVAGLPIAPHASRMACASHRVDAVS